MQSERMKHESTKENGTTLMSKDKLNKALIYGALKPLPNPFLSTLDMPAAPLGTAQIKPNGSLIHRLRIAVEECCAKNAPAGRPNCRYSIYFLT